MTIAFDSKTDSGNIVISPFTFSHTTSGSNRALFVCIAYASNNTSAITAVSYNGVALARATISNRNFASSEIWYLANPASGSNTVSLTGGDAISGTAAIALSFTGVDSAVLDGLGTNIGSSTSISGSVTTSFSNSWVLDCASVNNSGSSPITITVSAAQTERSSTTSGSTSTRGASTLIAVSPGANSMSWTINSSLQWAEAIVGIKAFVPAVANGAFLMNFL